jgi:hypothetical protein
MGAYSTHLEIMNKRFMVKVLKAPVVHRTVHSPLQFHHIDGRLGLHDMRVEKRPQRRVVWDRDFWVTGNLRSIVGHGGR